MVLTIVTRRELDVSELDALVTQASADGFRHVYRLRDDWLNGHNRFEEPGEAFFVATIDGRIVGVCGLNVDPYADDPAVGRVRRLYVVPDVRRKGAGAALVSAVVDAARGSFRKVTVRTDEDLFFRATGFERVEGIDATTHQIVFEDG